MGFLLCGRATAVYGSMVGGRQSEAKPCCANRAQPVVYLDATGRATRAEQVLTEPNFQKTAPGVGQDEVRQMLGRPYHIRGLRRARGEVWSHRYDNHFCQWFQVEISLEQLVRSAGFGQPLECMGNNHTFTPYRELTR